MSQRLRNPAANDHLPHVFIKRGRWTLIAKQCNMQRYIAATMAVDTKNATGHWPVRNTGLAGPGQLG